ncbi:MAG: GNAT family N-acetyltransferase [Syntrophaceae bacterium]|nr:GNAT family N-acetyltransferase [Syntrophaceae bacterium]
MIITLKEDVAPDVDFYYREQFKIYHEPYLIWNWETWEMLLATCKVYRVEVDGKYAGDVILEGKPKGTGYIVDFSLLPEYQGKGIGKAILEEVKKMARRLTAITRKEKLAFFLKSGFTLSKMAKDYYDPGVDGYHIVFG